MSIENFFFRSAVANASVTRLKYKILYGDNVKKI